MFDAKQSVLSFVRTEFSSSVAYLKFLCEKGRVIDNINKMNKSAVTQPL